MTVAREALIEKLAVSLHLDVPERRLLGSDCVSVEEVAAVVKRLLNPIRPTELADRSSSEYDDLDEAVSKFIESEWSKGIDGIGLTRRSEP